MLRHTGRDFESETDAYAGIVNARSAGDVVVIREGPRGGPGMGEFPDRHQGRRPRRQGGPDHDGRPAARPALHRTSAPKRRPAARSACWNRGHHRDRHPRAHPQRASERRRVVRRPKVEAPRATPRPATWQSTPPCHQHANRRRASLEVGVADVRELMIVEALRPHASACNCRFLGL